MNCARPFDAQYLVIAAVSVVFPWSTCPMVPTFTCGLLRSNFSLAMISLSSLDEALLRAGGGCALRLRDDGLRDAVRDLRVMRELHGVGGAALRLRAQIRRVPEHLGERHERVDHLGVRARGHRLDLAAAAVEVADDVAHVVVGRHDLDLHDRLEQDGARARGAVLEADRAGDLERHLGRVDVVVAAVEDLDLEVDHRVAGEHAARHGLLDALLDRVDELPGDRAAHRGVLELESLPRLLRDEAQPAVAVLAAAARLADVAALRLDHLRDGLAVGDLRLADVRLDLELAEHAVHEDLEVELRLGEHHPLEDDGAVLLAERVARRRGAQADGGGDVARVDLLDLLA